ncbi:hypothetical protein ACFYXL_09535 [Streptomyces tsukubensis]|uniref:hypothetical protein n=1 Tax=Streptomyces tsukubensis TaxID=83656 RepID=UPI0036877BED
MDKVPPERWPKRDGDALAMLIKAGGWVHPEGETADGANIPPGSMAFPPCQCPRHRFREPATDPVLSAKVAAANDRSRKGRGGA